MPTATRKITHAITMCGRRHFVMGLILCMVWGCDRGRPGTSSAEGETKHVPAVAYRIALDDHGGTTVSYLAAARRGGIPCAFLIGSDGRIAWIGHPGGLDEPLAELIHTGNVSEHLLEPSEPGATLVVGDPAPKIRIDEWLVGEPVPQFTPGHIYVVEFWATWCGPCVRSIPHLSELQTQYPDRMTIIGVTQESQRVVSRFLAALQ